jgi:hypothetical protein
MTKSTLKILLAGGGLVATWLAVTPNDTTAPKAGPTSVDRARSGGALLADDLAAQEAKLRQHNGNGNMLPRPSTRNPFRFGAKQSAVSSYPAAAAAPVAPIEPPQPARLSLSLSGIAERKTPEGSIRTAIISGEGQLYLVTEGEMVAGRYLVKTIDSDAVTLDERGAEIRLVMH